ncbi:ATP-grasp domain-containing protein [Parabacteroides distasonis]|uniref:ATP-grasp domain-containing protein n=1 Tax=Parabacteroides distasonis TaxID=823 RepID=UPI0018A0D86C|nr:hypothetical protein [Parabacteroides distasonis]MDB9153762.1 hypothetical protein [Parabacteroides distasonis]MDB9158401.1 hypothetical protein [Parabacteroides distasonis]MDB9167152.1 hypothetical protein [Parabacteroides distasonis]MDB9171688.1 hypothetical protein [Parabacteroides distasonis]MDB9193747.1 hypothetical protein [Parabacteroides distasonis]
MKWLICARKNRPLHSTNYANFWAEYAEKECLQYEIVDLLAEENPINVLKHYDCLLWHFDNYNYEEMLEARSILYTAKKIGLNIFPNFNEAWHFDDKIAQMYLLQSINAPIPESQVFYDFGSLKTSIKNGMISFPIVAKLRTGSGSHNVKLIKTKSQLLQYGRKMFGRGFKPAPSLIYKTSSNIRSSHDWVTFKAKAKRIPEFLRTLSNAKKFPREKGYVYLQEFIPNDNFDMKVVILGDKCTGFYRPVRSHDFRASGGGQFVDDPSIFTEQIIRSAFAVADALKMRCVGFDYVIDTRTGEGKIIEMSYGFAHNVMGAGGYFDRNCIWHDEPISGPVEIIKMMLNV